MFRPAAPPPPPQASTKSYEERAKLCVNPTAQKLLGIMVEKKSNLCLSADVESIQELLALIELAGPSICILKLHWDILPGFNEELIQKLKALAITHNFIIFQDSKFSDIGNIAKLQYGRGIFPKTPIADWSPIINAHTVAGPGILEALNEVATSEQFKDKGNACLVVAEMSSEGTLAKDNYTIESVKMAEKYPEFVIGFVTQHVLSHSEAFLNFTPGIQIGAPQGTLGQQYNDPGTAFRKGTDIIIVGSGIYGKKTLKEKSESLSRHQEQGWNAYLERIAVKNENTSTMGMRMDSSITS
jgi:orotidine 5'-phosphate decarboxylase subfamily 1